MNIIKAYFILNLKMLAKDKLGLIWSIFLPTFFIVGNGLNLNNAIDLRYYWAYIILNSYIFGIGLHALRQKEYGTLKTFFSIKFSRWEFFVASLLTQMVFIETSLILFNWVASIFSDINFLTAMALSNILLVAMIPMAFFTFNITRLKKIHVNSLTTLITIIISVCLFMMGVDARLVFLNPLYYTANILLDCTYWDVCIYISISIVFIISGVRSICNYSILSNEVR